MDVSTIAIIRLRGAINVNGFTAEAQKLYDAGTRNLLVDMCELTFLSSAGIRALQATARMYSADGGSKAAQGQSGEKGSGAPRSQVRVKLFNPSEDVRAVLEMVGLKGYFEVFTDLDAAMASFQ
jgi:anti-anti-sigma regulatory factor